MTTGSLFPSVSKYLFSFSRNRCSSTRTIELVVGSKSGERPRASTPIVYSLSSSDLPSKYFKQRNWSSRARWGDLAKVVEERTNFSSARSCWVSCRTGIGLQRSTKDPSGHAYTDRNGHIPRDVHGNRLGRLLALRRLHKFARRKSQPSVYHRSNARDLRYIHGQI